MIWKKMQDRKIGKKEGALIAIALILIVIVAIVAVGPWPSNENKPEVQYPPNLDEGNPPSTISHTILSEMFISQDCGNCSYSEEALHALDMDEGKLITVVHLVGAVDGAQKRYEEAKNGTVFPDVEFDGGYRSLIGNATYRDYKNKTMECMTRTVMWVNLDTSITTSPSGYRAHIEGSLPGGSTEGILRVYLVEKNSTDYTAYGGKSIHDLVIGYLYDNTIVLKTSEKTEIDIPIDYVENTENLAVVAAFYTLNTEHSVQAVMADFP